MRSLVAALLLGAGILMVPGNPEASEVMTGLASVDFGRVTRFDGGRYQGMVATGERFKASVLAVAHRTLPLGSHVMVRYRGRTACAVVNDRGPCLSAYCQSHAPKRVRDRVLDMMPRLASRLGFPGLGRVAFWPVACR